MVIQDDLGDDAALLHYYSASYVSLMFIKTDCLHWTYSKGNKKRSVYSSYKTPLYHVGT